MKVLVVVDMQNDFITGSLGTKEAQAIVENVKQKINVYRQSQDKIIFTRDTHHEDYLKTQEGQKLPISHCIEKTVGWNIAGELPIEKEDVILNKNSFGSIELGTYIQSLENIESIEFIGLCTDICVISNALIVKASVPEIPIFVDANCCGGTTPENHLNALRAMECCQITVQRKENKNA